MEMLGIDGTGEKKKREMGSVRKEGLPLLPNVL